MSYPLTPDSASYQEIALRVAVNDVLNRFDNLSKAGLGWPPRILAELSPQVEALRIARTDLEHAPSALRISANSFLSAFDFAASSHPSLDLSQYLQGAKVRLNLVFAAPDPALVASQEDTLRGIVGDFLAAWKTSQETSAPNRADFPHLPPLPTGRLRADWVQSRQESSAQKRLKQADKALRAAYENFIFAPIHLRLALSHFLMTWGLLRDYDGDLALNNARRSLQKAFDPATPPARSVYQAEQALAV
jgi:hypothetical protein